MSTAAAWSQRSPERREKLIRAAIAVITELGLEAATTRRVATHAGVSLGSVHYVFANKNELLAAVIDFVGDSIETALRPSAADRDRDDQDASAAL
ncbi:TetR/AcrR family transcriptional regulator, partial [Mycobacterium montefiorense]